MKLCLKSALFSVMYYSECPEKKKTDKSFLTNSNQIIRRIQTACISRHFPSVPILDLKCIACKLEFASASAVLQGQQLQTQTNRYAVLAFTYQRAQQSNKGMAENHTKSLYQTEEDYKNICFHKS